MNYQKFGPNRFPFSFLVSLRFLVFVGLSCLFHGLIFFSIHQTPIICRSSEHFNQLSTQKKQAELQQLIKKEKTEQLGKIFAQLKAVPSNLKEDFHELSYEFTPSPLLTYPKGKPSIFSQTPPTLSPPSLDTLSTLQKTHPAVQVSSVTPVSTNLLANSVPAINIFNQNQENNTHLEITPDAFSVKVEVSSKKTRPGYVFKITLTPAPKKILNRFNQTYYFLIDRSNSIPRGRFILNKKMVSQALSQLKQNDHFNILFFDDGVEKFSQQPVLFSEESVYRARDFLEKGSHGGYFAATDLYSSLGKILPSHVEEHSLHTAFLLSDGDTYLPLEQQRQTIGEWTAKNKGQISLYSVTSGGGNNLPLLDLISYFNKGMLLYSRDPMKMEKRFIHLVQKIRNPIGRDLSITALTGDTQTHLRLQPQKMHLPNLYLNAPYVIYGSTNRLSEFILFIQGFSNGKPFDLKKRITFDGAIQGGPDIEKKWTQMVAYKHYQEYLLEGNPKQLEVARQLLEPLKLPLPLSKDVHISR